ncbi:Uncharacterised protein [Bordetella pertussis]|nr:Uncharacterised protein [Bordetella pertussis]
MVMAAASTGSTAISRNAVISQVQQNSGIFISVMPGARMFSTVTMMLIAPMMDEAPMMCSAKMVRSMPGPIWADSGAYSVQPAAVAPPGTKNDTVSMMPATGSSQKLKLFMRANAMLEAPICKGIIQLAKPTNAGMTAPNTMIRPCMVVNWLNSSGRKNCRPGSNSSVRSNRASTPPSISMKNEKMRYIVPISLWLVAKSQRRQPLGMAWWWSS